jgi:phage terminase large subunit GpA-like protein
LSVALLTNAFADGLQPPEMLDLAEWSEKNIHLSREDSAVPGLFQAWPFQIEPMRVMSPRHPAERVVILASSQIVKTRLLLNLTAYAIAVDPGPILFVEPRQQDIDTVSKDRVTPMLRDCPVLAGKVAPSKSRDSQNTIDHKVFQGGSLSFGIAGSPSSLSMRPIRYLLLDEISRPEYASGKEGDPITLAEARTATFQANRKIVYVSSPGIEGDCRISKMYRGDVSGEDYDASKFSDQREWFVPCPKCGHEQILEWSGITWSQKGQPVEFHEDGEKKSEIVPSAKPRYRCAACDWLIPERLKSAMNAKGRYIAQNPDGEYPGFRIGGLNSPVRGWGDIVSQYIRAKGDPGKEQAFVNTVLAETWKNKGEAPPYEKVFAQRDTTYRAGMVPQGPLFLTAGVDIQGDRWEASLYGWGRRRECWLIEHHVEYGKFSEQKTKDALAEWKSRTWEHVCGAQMNILRLAIDSGYDTNEVYLWARTQGNDVIVVDGRESLGNGSIVGSARMVDINYRGRKIKRGMRIYPVDTSKLKYELYGRLEHPIPEPGEPYPVSWLHLPEQVDMSFCRQLVAEQVISSFVRGHQRRHWEKVKGARNEALDCWVYARAAAHQVGADRFDERHWRRLESFLVPVAHEGPVPEPVAAPERAFAPPMPMPARKPKPRSIGSSWVNS